MTKLSICIIANNEEKIIEEGLLSILPIADEIIFVDTGCTDSTPEIMRKYTDKIYKYKWIQDFSDAYNCAHSKATSDFVMAWNADYVIDKASLENLKKAKARNFDKANIINLRWNTEVSENGEPLIWVSKGFITKPSEIQYIYPDHCKPVAKNGFKTKVKSYENICIGERSQDRNGQQAKQRKLETMQRVRNFLLKNPHDAYFKRMLIEELFFHDKFEECRNLAEKYLQTRLDEMNEVYSVLIAEKLIQSHINLNQIWEAKEAVDKYAARFGSEPIYKLLAADVAVLLDPEIAQNLYLEFIQNSKRLGWHRNDWHRLEVHPYLMLGKIALLCGDKSKARTNFDIAKSNSRAAYINQELSHLSQLARN